MKKLVLRKQDSVVCVKVLREGVTVYQDCMLINDLKSNLKYIVEDYSSGIENGYESVIFNMENGKDYFYYLV